MLTSLFILRPWKHTRTQRPCPTCFQTSVATEDVPDTLAKYSQGTCLHPGQVIDRCWTNWHNAMWEQMPGTVSTDPLEACGFSNVRSITSDGGFKTCSFWQSSLVCESNMNKIYIPGTSGCAKLSLEVETTLFFAVWYIFCSFSKNNAVSCLGFWLLGNACQPDLFLRFLDGKLPFLDGKLCRFKFFSAPLWEVQVPQNGPKPKNARRQKKMQVPQKSNNFWKSKILTSFGRSRYIHINDYKWI